MKAVQAGDIGRIQTYCKYRQLQLMCQINDAELASGFVYTHISEFHALDSEF